MKEICVVSSIPALVEMLRIQLGDRRLGPVFRRRRVDRDDGSKIDSLRRWEDELTRRGAQAEVESGHLTRQDIHKAARKLWRGQGYVEEDQVRLEFMKVTDAIGLPEYTSPKMTCPINSYRIKGSTRTSWSIVAKIMRWLLE
jgi:hypothetical protein